MQYKVTEGWYVVGEDDQMGDEEGVEMIKTVSRRQKAEERRKKGGINRHKIEYEELTV